MEEDTLLVCRKTKIIMQEGREVQGKSGTRIKNNIHDYLPTSSPEFNPIELAFNKMKAVAKQENIRQSFHRNIHVGVYNCLEQITEHDMRGFYRHTGYIAI